jgi:hypothetical protein
MISNIKPNCITDLSASIKRTASWRRQLQTKFSDSRNGLAAATLDRLADEIFEMTDEQFSRLAAHYDWSSPTWSEAVSEVSRRVGYRGVDTVPVYVSHLVGILSQSVAA